MSEKPTISSVFAGRYQIKELIGQGGMGAVYLAHDPLLDLEVAVKTVNVNFDRPDALVRFQNEAITTGKLSHPNVARTLNFGLIESSPYMVMEYVKGDSLASIIRQEGRLDPKSALPIFVDIVAGLKHAHEQGVLHRDLKPSNVIITHGANNRIEAKIVDFGIAKVQGSDFRITDSNSFVGSPLYVSPEQAKNLEVDERTDVYSLGCLMFETLTGTPPIQADQIIDTIHKKCTVDAPSLSSIRDLAFPPALSVIVDTCLKRKKEERYSDIAAVGFAINAVVIETESLTAGEISNTPQPETQKLAINPASKPAVIVSAVVSILLVAVALFTVYKTSSSQTAARVNMLKGPDMLRSPAEVASDEKDMRSAEAEGDYRKPAPEGKDQSVEEKTESRKRDRKRAKEAGEIGELSFFAKADQAMRIDPINKNRADISKWSTDADLAVLKGHKEILYLYLLNCQFIEGPGLRYAEDLPLVNLCILHTPIGDGAMQSIGKIKSLKLLMVTDCPITDQGLSYLTRLDRLQLITITSPYVTDLGVAHLAALRRLTSCSLIRCPKVTDACVSSLIQLPNLQGLDFSYSSVTSKGLLEILSAKNNILCLCANGLPISESAFDAICAEPLAKLELLDCPIVTNRHLERLSEKSSLEALSCNCKKVDARGIAKLRKLKGLTSIHLQNLVCDKAVVHELLMLKNLQYVTLDNCRIYDEQLPGFASLRKLQQFKIYRCPDKDVTRAGLSILSKKFRQLNRRDLRLEFYGETAFSE